MLPLVKLEGRSPIVPSAIVPAIAPIAPAAISPSAVAPPITPGQLLLAGARIDGVCGNIGNRLANGGQPFGNSSGPRSFRLRSRWVLSGIARRGSAEQQGHADRAGRHDLRKNLEVSLPQGHPGHLQWAL